MSKRTYQSWLKSQKKLLKKAHKFISGFGLDARIIEREGKRSLLRVRISSKQSMFFNVKRIKSRFGREIWVCKVKDTLENTGFLIYAATEKSWLVITNREIQTRGTKKPSSYRSGEEYYVVPREYVGGAYKYFKRLKKSIEERKQKRLGEYM